jgi:hypothetical protein
LGCSGGSVLGNAGIVGAGVLLYAFPFSIDVVTAGHWQSLKRCIVGLLLWELGLVRQKAMMGGFWSATLPSFPELCLQLRLSSSLSFRLPFSL